MKSYKQYKNDTIQSNSLSFGNYEDEYEEFKLHAIGELIKEERKKANLSQDELAQKVNTRKTAISRLEKHCDDVKLSTLIKVSRALGKTLELSFK